MIRILDGGVKVWHLLVVGVLLGVLLGGTIGIAATPAASTPSVGFASAFATDQKPIEIFGNNTVRVLRALFTVPTGRTADIQTSFSASIWPNTTGGTSGSTACYGYFTLDSQSNVDPSFGPGISTLLAGSLSTLPSQVGVGLTSARRGIGEGKHFVNVYVITAAPGCGLFDRQLNVSFRLR